MQQLLGLHTEPITAFMLTVGSDGDGAAGIGILGGLVGVLTLLLVGVATGWIVTHYINRRKTVTSDPPQKTRC